MSACVMMSWVEVDITPEEPYADLVGYAERGAGAEGVADRLGAGILQLAGVERYYVVIIDTCLVTMATAAVLRGQLGAALGVAARQVHLICTHTHSGPLLCWHEGTEGARDPRLPLHGSVELERRYYAQVYAALLAGCRAGEARMRECRMGFHQGTMDLGYSRRSKGPDGLVRACWNIEGFPERAPEPLPDPTVSLLWLGDEAGEGVYLGAMGVHPVVMGKESRWISADWPGAVRAAFAERRGGRLAVVQDAGAEAHPWIATQGRLDALKVVGQLYSIALGRWAEQLGGGAPLTAVRYGRKRVALAQHALDIECLLLGRVPLVLLPVELFGSLSGQLRAQLGYPVVICTLANGWCGYVPDAAAYAEGGYEIEVAQAHGIAAGDGERLMAGVVALLAEMGLD